MGNSSTPSQNVRKPGVAENQISPKPTTSPAGNQTPPQQGAIGSSNQGSQKQPPSPSGNQITPPTGNQAAPQQAFPANKPTPPRKPVQPVAPAARPQNIKELQAKVARLELLMDVSRQFSSTLDFDKLMNTIFEKVLMVLEAEAGSFWVPDQAAKEIVCQIAEGPAKKQVTGLRLKEGTGIVGWVTANKQNTVIFDASKDERFSKSVDEKTHFVTKSMLCVPLVVENECVGAIQVINKKTADGQFTRIDLEALESLANSGAIAIKNARLYQSEQRIKELNTLLNISQELTSTLDLDRVLLSVVNLGSQVIHYKRAVIGLLGVNDQVFLAAESNQAAPDHTSSENIQLKAIFDYVIASGNSLYVNRYNKKAPPKGLPDIVIKYMNDLELHCLSVILLSDSEGKLGILSMEGIYATLVASQSQYIVNMVVNQATGSIRNAQLYQNIPATGMAERFKAGTRLSKTNLVKMAKIVMVAGLALVAAIVLPIPSGIIAEVEIVPAHKTQVSIFTGGVVKQVLFREGELVQKGQTLLKLDPALLNLEKAKLENDRLMIQSDLYLQESLGNAQAIHLKRLELQKLENQLKLMQQKLAYTTILAMNTGRVLTPKPEELLDKQVTEGEVVAEIAISDEKSAHLLIKEEDVLKINSEENASLTLQVLPGVVIAGKLQSVSQTKTESETGESHYIGYFTSQQLNEIAAVKFGMTGAAKIDSGQKTLYRIYLEPTLIHWLTQLKFFFS